MVSDFIPFARPDITEAEVDAVSSAVRSGWLTTGKHAASFESEFSVFLGDPDLHAVAVNSATAGLHLALEACGVGPGDEVLVPTWTFTSTAEVVRYLGADPVFVDSEPGSLNIDLDRASSAVGRRTKAIIPVHFAGLPVDPEAISTFARTHKLSVVEDAAHALPATGNGVQVGAGHSQATVFSFYATKTVTTGEGGMLVTRDKDLANRARVMRLHGISRDVFDRYTSAEARWYYEVIEAGYKYNLPDPAAALGRVQLGRAIEMRDRRAAVASLYLSEFRDLPLALPEEGLSTDLHSWHLFVVRLMSGRQDARDQLIDGLRMRGIGASVHFIPLHRHPYWRDRYQLDGSKFPVAESAYATAVSLPLYSAMKDSDANRVVEAVRDICAQL